MKSITTYNWIFRLTISSLIILCLVCCQDKKHSNKVKETAQVEEAKKSNSFQKTLPAYYASGIPVYEKFDDLKPIFNIKNDSTYVVNFWATWCKPCIKELPYFKDLDSIYKKEKLKVVLVSLDFPKDVDTKLVTFAKEKQIESKVVVLLDGKYNEWIDKVSPEWSGAIPATYIYNREKNILFQQSFENTQELVEVIQPFL